MTGNINDLRRESFEEAGGEIGMKVIVTHGDNWKTPVTDSSELPTSDNVTGDIRQALDTGIPYRWNGSAWVVWITGGGGGDMLKSENLSGLADYAVARQNLGLVIGVNVLAYRTFGDIVDSNIADFEPALGFTPENVANKSNDIIVDGSSTTKYPNVKIVKDYVDSMVAGLLDYRGAYDASGNTFPTTGGSGTAGAILKGDMFIISVGGTLGGVAIQVGDYLIANVDTPGQTLSKWDMLNTNIAYVPANDTAVVHNTGDETVNGIKTLEQIKFIDNTKSSIEFSHTGDGGGALWSYYNIGGWTGTELYNNAKYDGSNWVRFNITKPATSVFQDMDGNIQFWKSEAGANPITNWVMTRQTDKNGVDTMLQTTTPANPVSGYTSLYFKNDDKLYKKTSAGVESEIGGLAWGSSITGTSGTGLTLNLTDTLTADATGLKIVFSDTTANIAGTGINIDTGTANKKIGINIKAIGGAHISTGGVGMMINRFATATQALGSVALMRLGTNFNTNSSFNSLGLIFDVEDNTSTGTNTGIVINNASNKVSTTSQNTGLYISQTGSLSSAFFIQGGINLNTTIAKIRLSNTQAAASTLLELDTGTSAQAHTGLLVNCAGASTTQYGVNIKVGAGTGIGLRSEQSGTSGAQKLIQAKFTGFNTTNGTYGIRAESSNTAAYSDLLHGDGSSVWLGYFENGGVGGTKGVKISYKDVDGGYGLELDGSRSAGTNTTNWIKGIATLSTNTNTNLTTDPIDFQISRTSTATSGTKADNFNMQYLKRTSIQNGAGGTFTSAGSVLKLENVATQTAGTLTDTVTVLNIVQSAGSTGVPLKITQGAVVSTNFKKLIEAGGITIWMSDGTTAEGALSGTEGDICLNGGTGAGQMAYCDATGTNWTDC